MASVIVLKKGQLDIEEALGKMKWDTEKFEMELEMFAKTQSPQIQEKLRKQYNQYMHRCGWPMELVVISEPLPQLSGPKFLPRLPKKKQPLELPEIKPQTEPTVIAEATPTVEAASSQQTESVPETKEAETPIPLAVQEPDPTPQETKPNETETKTTENVQSQPETDKPAKVNIVADAYFSVSDPILLKRLFETIHGLLDEVTFQFGPDHLLIRAMDPSRVAMLDYTIKKEHFEEWEVKKPGYATFNIGEVLKVVFAAIKKDTTIKLTVNPVTDKLIFTLRDSRTRTREFPLLSTDEAPEVIPRPKIQFNALFKVASKEWQDDIAEMTKASDHVEIHVTQEGVKVKALGDYVKAENNYQKGSDILLDIQTKEDACAKFSLSYLAKDFDFFEPNLCDIVTIEMTTDMPIRATLHTKFGDLQHYLAPRIETE